MGTDRIDFISAYCDRWCERCAFTARCSAFAPRVPDGESDEIDPVQNDWNGSAKVALISIERSAHAWRTIAQALRDETAAMLADQMAALCREVESEFPAARSFVRPGFDEPWR